MNSLALEVQLKPVSQQRFLIEVTTEGKGEAEGESKLLYSNNELRTVLRALGTLSFNDEKVSWADEEKLWLEKQGWLRSGKKNPEQKFFTPDFRKQLGQQLFEVLFPVGKVRNKFVELRQQSKEQHLNLELRLTFNEGVGTRSRLADYPWELMYYEGEFLIQDQLSLSRYIRFGDPLPKLTQLNHHHLLLISPRPKVIDLDELSLKECEVIKQVVETKSSFYQLAEPEQATFSSLTQYLEEYREHNSPTIIHFDGHGEYCWRCQNCKELNHDLDIRNCENCDAPLSDEPEGFLAFEKKDGEVDWISADRFATTIRNITRRQGLASSISVVVLTACLSGVARRSKSVFNGVAQRLIKAGIPVVVAMGFSVSEDAATEFTRGFYQRLASGDTYEEAVQVGRTLLGYEDNQDDIPLVV